MPYCRDCGTHTSSSTTYCNSCESDINNRSKSRINNADDEEQRRMRNDHDYAHAWLQYRIDWIVALWDIMSKIFTGGCYITSAIVTFRKQRDDSLNIE